MNVERKNLEQKEVIKIIENFPINPRYSDVIITLNTIETEDGLELFHSLLDENQYVIAIGPMVKDLVPGEKVIINIEGMSVMTDIETEQGYSKIPQIKMDPLTVDGNVFTYLDDRKIKAKYNK